MWCRDAPVHLRLECGPPPPQHHPPVRRVEARTPRRRTRATAPLRPARATAPSQQPARLRLCAAPLGRVQAAPPPPLPQLRAAWSKKQLSLRGRQRHGRQHRVSTAPAASRARTRRQERRRPAPPAARQAAFRTRRSPARPAQSIAPRRWREQGVTTHCAATARRTCCSSSLRSAAAHSRHSGWSTAASSDAMSQILAAA